MKNVLEQKNLKKNLKIIFLNGFLGVYKLFILLFVPFFRTLKNI